MALATAAALLGAATAPAGPAGRPGPAASPGSAVTAGRGRGRRQTTTPPLTVDRAAWAGHGSLAVVSDGRLVVVSDRGTPTVVTGPPRQGYDTDPAWSVDHRWLTFLHVPPPVGASQPSPTLWMLPAGSSTARRVTSGGVGTVGWSPFADELAFTVVGRTIGTLPPPRNLFTDVPGRPPVRVGAVAAGEVVGSLAWSPDGRELAVDEQAVRPGPTPASPVTSGPDVLATMSTGGGPAIPEYQAAGAGLEVAGWWPDSTGILFWVDPGHSDAADGLTLDSLPLRTRVPDPLATTLVGHQWLAPGPAGGPDQVAVAAGPGRAVGAGGRQVTVCALPTATCAAVPTAPGTVGLAPAWTAGGVLLGVQAPTTGATGPTGPERSPQGMVTWDAANSLWSSTPPSWQPTPVDDAGPGTVLADPAASGTEALVVRDDALWLLDLAGSQPALRIAGPLYEPDAPPGYYGEVDWGAAFAWSAAPVGPAEGASPADTPAGEVP